MLSRRAKVMLLVLVRYATLHRTCSREDYLRLYHTVPERYQHYIHLEIHGAPPGASSAQVLETLASTEVGAIHRRHVAAHSDMGGHRILG